MSSSTKAGKSNGDEERQPLLLNSDSHEVKDGSSIEDGSAFNYHGARSADKHHGKDSNTVSLSNTSSAIQHRLDASAFPANHDGTEDERAPLIDSSRNRDSHQRISYSTVDTDSAQREDTMLDSTTKKMKGWWCWSPNKTVKSNKARSCWKFDKKTRIKIFIAVDVVFFLIEIVAGYSSHSLSLVADAFHMLNDVISLCVGLWATHVAENEESSNEYTYGWVRSELLGGFVNGVFLIALCVSLVLEAIQRFFEPQKVKNPDLVLIVGGIGLAFNIMGLFVFHQHSHGHGGEHDHNHSHADGLNNAETGHSHPVHTHAHETLQISSPQAVTDRGLKSLDISAGNSAMTPQNESSDPKFDSYQSHQRKRSKQLSRSRNEVPIHPASFRNEVIAKARMENVDLESESSDDTKDSANGAEDSQVEDDDIMSISHHNHRHRQAKDKPKGGHSHSHEDMNMRGIFLHVVGDALGNIGVMVSALVIKLSDWQFRDYVDPVVSLFITVIILRSAMPLVKEAGRSLLQATPRDVSVKDIKSDIRSLPGVKNCHHVHVWTLTAQKRIATVHVELDVDITKGPVKYMSLIKEIQRCLRESGVHSSTIQPEFYTGSLSLLARPGSDDDPDSYNCLLDADDAEPSKQCCPPRQPGSGTSTPRSNEQTHNRNRGYDHDHQESIDHSHK